MNIKNELSKIINPDLISDSPEMLLQYSRDESFVQGKIPSCVVSPLNTNEVQQIINWANRTNTPLVPVSSGPPHFRGDTLPGVDGSVIVNLGNMKNIIRIDAEHRVAMVEPGVTYSELVPEVTKAGLRLNIPLLARSSKSVVGSLMEREPVIMPRYHWDISDPLACTEVVYGTGDIFRTGSAAGPGTIEQQWDIGAAQNEAAGPIQADFYRLLQGSQGSMGIVTWASVRCERLPVLTESYLIGSSQLETLLEMIRQLMRHRIADICLILNNNNLARILTVNQPGDYKNVRDSLPQWILFFTISGYKYFPEDKISYQTSNMKELAASLNLEPLKAIGKASAFAIHEMLLNSAGGTYWKLAGNESFHDIFFITINEYLPGIINVMNKLVREYGYPLADMGVYIQPLVQGVNYHCEFNFFLESNNPEKREQIKQLLQTAFKPLTEQGAFFSRPYGPWADMAYQKDQTTAEALRKVKNIFDPKHILNPGKLCF